MLVMINSLTLKMVPVKFLIIMIKAYT